MKQREEPPPPPQGEKRKTLRAPMVILQVAVEDERRTFFGYARNISGGGMFIPTLTPREPGTRFQVEMTFPPPVETTVRCLCEVVWKRDYARKVPLDPGMGLKFLDLPEETAALIAGWVEQE